jgi:NAD+ synthase
MNQDEEGKSADSFLGREKTVFEIYKRLNTINQHKMQPIPVCLLPQSLK